MSTRVVNKYLALYIDNKDSQDYEYLEYDEIPDKIKSCRASGTLIQILNVTKKNIMFDFLNDNKNGFVETVYKTLIRNNMKRFPN